ncbi:transposase [Paraclostridium ghonii]|uniref:IS66 family transposase n=1 Tax=Paraclostridium ghonii TaxID=29358 RepID=UPI00202CE3E8|nr:transposase [Paeniclostridium ghonii]MCM0167874.1 transposase [Paeniclostridium ghonii]
MKSILKDGSLEVDNNTGERYIKPFVIGRKNGLFANRGRGAKSSTTIYSIIETAKSHGLSVEKYLVYLMDMLSNEITSIEDAMPWSKLLPEDLKIQSK